jgi:uncharacterized protein (DUF1499 family)
MPLLALAGERPSDLGVQDGKLAPCPSSPNCVSSDATDRKHAIEPLALAALPEAAWTQVREALGAMARVEIVEDTGDYLHAECRSALLGFVDDLELHLRPEDGVIAVRSASRLGYGDLGVNRRRVESLRSDLRKRGAVR